MKLVQAFGAVSLTVLLAACVPAATTGKDGMMADGAMKKDAVMADAAMAKAPGTIVAVAAGNPDFSTLVAAVKAAGLVDALNGKGPLTVLAPTNAAFAKLPAGTVETLLKPENKATLVKILTYHVLPLEAKAATVVSLAGKKVKTLEGTEITINVSGGKVSLTDAKGGVSNVTATDIAASNGVIHVIDTVLMPE
ncbi:fasciclin domain-containing protein [Deinococcus sp.]|uniref:fasciclin domain-containing protein n=1 Tax=Deinococcus sp. TaxID=47478 RepID=UPI0025E1FD21|nr:fasciclin domain-containing protein [Deinococcus sp.]